MVQRCNCFNRDVWKCRSLFKESYRGAVHHVCLSHCLLSFDQGLRFHEVQPGDSHQKPKHTLWSKPRLLRLFGSSIPGASQEHRKSASFRSYRPICLGHRETVSIVRPNLLDDAATWLTFHARISLRFHRCFTITTKQVEQTCTLNYQRYPKVPKQLMFAVQRCHPSQGILNTLQLPRCSCSAWRHPEMSLLLCPVALLVPTFSFARGSFVALISYSNNIIAFDEAFQRWPYSVGTNSASQMGKWGRSTKGKTLRDSMLRHFHFGNAQQTWSILVIGPRTPSFADWAHIQMWKTDAQSAFPHLAGPVLRVVLCCEGHDRWCHCSS